MKIQYRVLGKPRRQRIRQIARSAWIDTDADPSEAERMAQWRIQDQMYGVISSLMISIAIKLAIALIRHWLSQSVGVPPEDFQYGEPGCDCSIRSPDSNLKGDSVE